MANNAMHAANVNPVDLHNFNEEVVAKLAIRAGTWVVFGRVVIRNNDGDDQNVAVRLRTPASTIKPYPDMVSVRMEGETEMSFTLQAPFKPGKDSGDTIQLVCTTYDGKAVWGSLIAIEVDQVLP